MSEGDARFADVREDERFMEIVTRLRRPPWRRHLVLITGEAFRRLHRLLPAALADWHGEITPQDTVPLGTVAELRGTLHRAMPEVMDLAADHDLQPLTVASMLLAYASAPGDITAPITDEELTAPQAAERLGIDRNTVLQAITDGRLPARRVGDKLWLVRLADVDAYARRRRPRPRRADQIDA